MTVGDLGEHAIIERIHARVPAAPPSVIVGIGDDAAVTEPDRGTVTVVTTDALVEGVHYEPRFTPPDAIGFRALAASLSDLAGMGAAPRHALLSMALPDTLPISDLDGILDGLLGLAARHGTHLIGGNITRSGGPLFIEVTALGSVKRRRVLTRGGARPGDWVWLSGTVGAAAAGLARLQGDPPASSLSTDARCSERWLRPEPRVRLGTLLGRNRAANACVDLSDGLADGIHQLAAASRVGMTIDADAIPVDAGARGWFEQQGADPLVSALTGGDDYELLFTVSAKQRRPFDGVRRLVKSLPITKIGEVTKGSDVVLRRGDSDEALPSGYEHFRTPRT